MKGLIILLLIFALAIMSVFLGLCIAAMYHAIDNDCDDEPNIFYDEEEY